MDTDNTFQSILLVNFWWQHDLMWLFDSEQNVSSSGAQGKQSSNCAVGLL